MSAAKAVIFAPFWNNLQHVGQYRVDRFVRWFGHRSVQVVVVGAGATDDVQQMLWGWRITVADPLGIYGTPSASPPARRPNHLRRLLAYLVFNPDPTIVWATRSARHPLVLEYGAGADLVLASSPPESSLIGAAALACSLKTKFVADMRDGWLDEPLKPLLKHFPAQRWREARLEAAVLRQANYIFVTSDNWRDMLIRRLPFTRDKTTVLTNGYPLYMPPKAQPREPLTLLHTGRFVGSSGKRRAALLLSILLPGLRTSPSTGEILLLGDLEAADWQDISHYKPQVEAVGWALIAQSPIPRQAMLDLLPSSAGLLLLSASDAAIPSKLFEYLLAGRPILSLSPKDSAVWRLTNQLPQVFSVDYAVPRQAETVVRDFLTASASREQQYPLPMAFSEQHLENSFFRSLNE